MFSSVFCHGNTFRPKINEASRLLDRNSRPLHERVGQVQRDRQQKRHEAQAQILKIVITL